MAGQHTAPQDGLYGSYERRQALGAGGLRRQRHHHRLAVRWWCQVPGTKRRFTPHAAFERCSSTHSTNSVRKLGFMRSHQPSMLRDVAKMLRTLVASPSSWKLGRSPRRAC